jgi:hypothetical protein
MNKQRISDKIQPCDFIHFGLIVTGKGERAHLPKLFRSLEETSICTFEVIRYIGQRTPITSKKRQLEMVGSGKIIPDKDATEIGLPARGYVNRSHCHFVILIDDLEHDRRAQAQQVFDRYRLALDTMLKAQKHRTSVHFLVNMLEAYYFADAKAINAVLNLDLADYEGDVEEIRHPKGEIRKHYPGFREIEHGGSILEQLDVEHVLSRPDTCASLRTLFAWCVKVLERYPDYQRLSLTDKYQLPNGRLSELTQPQLRNGN